MGMIAVNVNSESVSDMLKRVSNVTSDMSVPMKQAGIYLQLQTDLRFKGRDSPDGTSWPPLKKSTVNQRRGKSNVPLQDSGKLRMSFNSRGGAGAVFRIGHDSLEYGSNLKAPGGQYSLAAIHQFGVRITMPPRQGQVKLRTTKTGKLVRQKGYPNLVRFAGRRHTQFVSINVSYGSHVIVIPPRPMLGLNDEMAREIDTIFLSWGNRILGGVS